MKHAQEKTALYETFIKKVPILEVSEERCVRIYVYECVCIVGQEKTVLCESFIKKVPILEVSEEMCVCVCVCVCVFVGQESHCDLSKRSQSECLCIHVCMCVCLYVCMYVCMNVNKKDRDLLSN